MPLSAGTRLGSYEIIASIGAGGMGEVYLARDTQLGRDVALKVLPEAFAQDAERLARFRREAQVVASLNHPNIAAIYGLESGAGASALALEFVSGEDLAARIARGPIPIDEAVAIARQIADALEAAHEQGIVHRDLKPANIKLKPAWAPASTRVSNGPLAPTRSAPDVSDCVVKVLDFGLAKALAPDAASATAEATMTSPAMTAMGMILGTAAYMAPEQAKGRPVDRRADIWAFGVVLFEMLTGRQMFPGETVSDVLAAVLRQDIDWTHLPAATPPAVRRLLARCLDRDPRTRLRDIGEARVALSSPERAAPAPDEPAPATASSRQRVFVWATIALALALGVVSVLWWRGPAPVAQPVVRFDLAPPDGATLNLATRPTVGISPDGRTIVFAAMRDGVSRLYVRRRDEVEALPIAGTEGASNPVVSPDGRFVAFFANNTLKKVPFDGPVVTLVSGLGDTRGIAWLDAATIVYGPGAIDGLMRVGADGGSPVVLTTVDQAKGERTHRWPAVVPGGRAVLFTTGLIENPDTYENAPIDLVIVATGERRTLFKGGSFAIPTTAGRLLIARGGSLHAVAFDAERLVTEGQVSAFVQGIAGDVTTGAAHASIAADGTLVYVPGDAHLGSNRRLAWLDAAGTISPVPGLAEAVYNDVSFSPDGSKLAVLVGPSGSGDVWIYDIGRTTFTRFTFTGTNATPVWSADGRAIYYASVESTGRKTVLWRRPADGSRDAEQVVAIDSRAYITALEKDAAIVAYYGMRQIMTNIVRVPFAAGAKPVTLVGTNFDEYAAALSRDGRWLAYQSDESGRYEVYVRDLAPGGGQHQISTALGEEPRWSSDGQTLYYRADESIMAVPIDTRRGTFVAGTPRIVFKGAYNLRSDTGNSFAVDPRTDRLLMIRPAVERQTPAVLRVVLNWMPPGR
jgi:serine/threonine-protein kinase